MLNNEYGTASYIIRDMRRHGKTPSVVFNTPQEVKKANPEYFLGILAAYGMVSVKDVASLVNKK